MASAKRQSPWLPTGEITLELGITADHLYRLRDEGLLKLNLHYRIISRPQAARKTYRWHKQRCEKALETPQEFR